MVPRPSVGLLTVWTTALAAALLVTVGAQNFTPHPETGYPAGYLPECPGVTKNASISSRMMAQLQVVFHRVDVNGNIIRKNVPITAAHKIVARDKYVDLKKKKTVFYAVGYLDSSVFPHNQALGTAYSKRGYNVFISETIQFLTYTYPKSVRLCRIIGKKIGEFLVKLYEQGLNPENLELVGSSLGGHIIAYASKYFIVATGRKPSRITGLDPAGPCFRSLPREARLNPSDAERVDVVHTNIDGFGIAETLGHVDFYVNGGEFQPGDIPSIPCLVICSHVRAFIYYWQALEHPKKFIGVKCNSVQEARLHNCYNSSVVNYMGVETSFNKPGIYYLSTNNEFPYYREKEGLKSENEIFTSFIRNINSDDEFEV